MEHSADQTSEMRLYSRAGARLYLNRSELERFIAVADLAPIRIRCFALTLAYTGVRPTEARNLHFSDLQLDMRRISVGTLKRRKPVVREIPVPQQLIDSLRELNGSPDQSLWPELQGSAQRTTAYRWIKALMAEAGIDGPKACPKGLRHAFGVVAVMENIPLHMIQRWMGHASMKTTAIYTAVLGPEELELSGRMWR